MTDMFFLASSEYSVYLLGDLFARSDDKRSDAIGYLLVAIGRVLTKIAGFSTHPISWRVVL